MVKFTFQPIDETTCAAVSFSGHDEAVRVPAVYEGMDVVMLSDGLFAGHDEIRHILLPKSLKYIGSRVFDGCRKLKSLRLPDGIEAAAGYAFSGSGLEIIEIPGSLGSIIPYTFADCKTLNTVVVRKGVSVIHACAFEGCENLELVAVPSDTEISHEAFKGCIKLNPNLTRKLVASCQCPACTGAAKLKKPAKDPVKDFLRRKSGLPL